MKGYKDMRRIKRLWVVCLFAAVWCACSVEQDEIIPPVTSTDNAIEFTFAFPDDEQDVATRAKTGFTSGDKAYVTAEVITSDGTRVESTILRYNGSRWVADGTVLSWPENSLKATFSAYLFPRISDNWGSSFYTPELSMTENFSLPIPLSSFKERSTSPHAGTTDDPFMARVTDIPVNGIVPLQFAHTTSKLIVTGLKHGITNKVRFYNANTEFKINNQIVFKYSKAEGFTHEFVHNPGIDNFIEQEVEITESGSSQASRVTFFLNTDPAWEENIEFRLSQITESGNYGTDDDGEEIKVKVTSLAEKAGLRTMQRGRAYSMYFLDSQTNTPFIEEEKWYADPTLPTHVFTDAEEIINYFNGLTSLDRDLDFNFIDIEGLSLRSLLSTKAIALTQSLNGNYHTIKNISVKNGLFNEIPSGVTIRNLRLENVKVESTGEGAAGLLAPVNSGTISNVRISGNNSIGADRVSSVGGMVGINGGTITDSQIEGTLIMECYATGSFMAGGFVGDNGGDITGSEVISASIVRAAASGGAVYAGGFAGMNGGSISSSSSNTLVDATQVNGSSYTGGFAGENKGTLVSCEATGDVKGGMVSGYLGGFVGNISGGTVDKCYATGYVYERVKSTYIGGFGGFSLIDLTNCSSTGKLFLAGDKTNAGALVGILDSTKAIRNSFSVSTTSAEEDYELGFGGTQNVIVENCHYLGYILDTTTGVKTGTPAYVLLLNNGRGTYSEWTSNSSYIGGVPYLIK